MSSDENTPEEGIRGNIGILTLNERDLTEPETGMNVLIQLKLVRVDNKKAAVSLSSSGRDFGPPPEEITIENMYQKFKKTEVYFEVLNIFSGQSSEDKNRSLPADLTQSVTRLFTEAWRAWRNTKVQESARTDVIDDSVVIPTEFLPDIEDEAERILSSSKPMGGVNTHLSNLIAGEEGNKQFIFTLAVTGKTEDFTKKTIICGVHEAGAGKSHILGQIASLYNCHTVSHLTKRALNYIGEQIRKHHREILYIKELGNLDRENDSYGNASIKMLSVDDGGLSTSYAFKDENTGRFDVETVTTDPITVMTSTTKRKIDAQFMRRFWTFSPDASKLQTDKIRKFKSKNKRQEYEVRMGKRLYTDMDHSREVLRCIVSKLPTDTYVIIPFIDTLYSVLDTSNIRIRGDFDKLTLLMEMYGIINYMNLPREIVGGNSTMLLTPERAMEMLKIAREPLIYMAKGTEARIYLFLKALKELNLRPHTSPNEATGEDGYSGDEINQSKQIALGRLISKKRDTVIENLNELVQMGYLRIVADKKLIYMLTMPIEDVEAGLSGYPTLRDEEKLFKLKCNMVDEANDFFEKSGMKIRFPSPLKTLRPSQEIL